MLLLGKGKEEVVYYSKGTGDNLLDEDERLGYIDYIYYKVYANKKAYEDDDEPIDEGQILLREYYEDLSIEERKTKVLDMAYLDGEWFTYED